MVETSTIVTASVATVATGILGKRVDSFACALCGLKHHSTWSPTSGLLGAPLLTSLLQSTPCTLTTAEETILNSVASSSASPAALLELRRRGPTKPRKSTARRSKKWLPWSTQKDSPARRPRGRRCLCSASRKARCCLLRVSGCVVLFLSSPHYPPALLRRLKKTPAKR